MSKFSIMKPIDKFLVENIEKLTITAEYQKLLDTYNSWEDRLQNAFKGILIFLSFAIPLLIVFIFYLLNSSAKTRLETTEQIIETGNSIISTSSQVRSISNKFFGKPISSKANFERELANSLPSQGIDSEKILIGEFSLEEIDGINELRSDLKFSKLSSENFYGLLNILSLRLKMKVQEIIVKKNEQSNLLEGTLTILHYSPIPQEL